MSVSFEVPFRNPILSFSGHFFFWLNVRLVMRAKVKKKDKTEGTTVGDLPSNVAE